MLNFVGQKTDGLIAGTGITSGSISPSATDSGGMRQATIPAWSADGVAPTGWSGNGPAALPAAGASAAWGTGAGGLMGVLAGLINQLGALVDGYAGESGVEGTTAEHVVDGSFASTGDPHLSETASVLTAAGTTSSVSRKFDSMTGHDNVLSSQDFDGGYRLSTTVTSPDANGVTMNATATVHMNNGSDAIALRNDGSFTIASNGNDISLADGQSVILGGGELVTNSGNGSLTVAATNAYGGAITTTLAAKGGGVDVTATVHNVNVGGDIANAPAAPAPAPAAPAPAPAPTPPPVEPPEQPGEPLWLQGAAVSEFA